MLTSPIHIKHKEIFLKASQEHINTSIYNTYNFIFDNTSPKSNQNPSYPPLSKLMPQKKEKPPWSHPIIIAPVSLHQIRIFWYISHHHTLLEGSLLIKSQNITLHPYTTCKSPPIPICRSPHLLWFHPSIPNYYNPSLYVGNYNHLITHKSACESMRILFYPPKSYILSPIVNPYIHKDTWNSPILTKIRLQRPQHPFWPQINLVFMFLLYK